MTDIRSLTKDELEARLAKAEADFEAWKARGLSLDLTRGKPSAAQLDLTEDMLTILSKGEDCFTDNGLDCRNYGVLDGIPEAKKLFADLLGVPQSRLIIGGNSALNMM